MWTCFKHNLTFHDLQHNYTLFYLCILTATSSVTHSMHLNLNYQVDSLIVLSMISMFHVMFGFFAVDAISLCFIPSLILLTAIFRPGSGCFVKGLFCLLYPRLVVFLDSCFVVPDLYVLLFYLACH